MDDTGFLSGNKRAPAVGERRPESAESRSRSRGLPSVQLVRSGRRQEVFQASDAVIWRDQRIFPIEIERHERIAAAVAGPL